MAEFKITGVKQAELSDELLAANLDNPVAGTESDVLVIRLAGWALGRTSPVVSVRVFSRDGVKLHTAPIGVDRTDVAEAYPDVEEAGACGFDILLGMLGLPEEFELRVQVVLENGTQVSIGAVQGRHRPLRPSFEPQIPPILMTTLGRSGGSFLMRLLSEHPEIVIFPRHPYESIPARYWLHMLRVLSQPTDFVADPLAQSTFDQSLSEVGPNPFFDAEALEMPELGRLLTRDYAERLTSFCLQSIEEWYAALAGRLGLDRVRYFAEKHSANSATLTRALYPGAKEIFLVRDFRDTLCSILAFYRRPGYPSYPGSPGESDEEFIRRYGGGTRLLAVGWRQRSESSHLIRYEDLVRNPEQTLGDVLEYLELEASPELVDRIVTRASEEREELGAHRTTPDAEASIGRWQRERDGSFAALCDESFGDVLEEFGYERAGDTADV